MYDMLVTTPLLVVGASATDTINEFLSGGIGTLLSSAMGIGGFLILLFAVFKAVKDVLAGKIGGAVKSVLGGAIIAAMLIAPGATLGGLIDWAGDLIGLFTDSAETITPDGV